MLSSAQVLYLAVLAIGSAISVSSLPSPPQDQSARFVEEQWIVKMRANPSSPPSARLVDHITWLEQELADSTRTSRLGYKPQILHHFNIGPTFMGYAARAPESILQKVASDMWSDVVEYVTKDGLVSVVQQPVPAAGSSGDGDRGDIGVQQDPPSWGLERICKRDLPLPDVYTYPRVEREVSVYVIDTGIDITHPDFEGRAVWGANLVDEVNTDENGHGTHTAGTIGSKTYGVAKQSKIVAVKVLGAGGSGSYSTVIAGIDWVAQNAPPGKSIASMSLGGEKNRAADDAVNAAVARNIPFVVAAGNDYAADACNVSPAGAARAFTVSATTAMDALAAFSNVGKCVEILAPGVDIVSTAPYNGTRTLSGTSMAVPHVSGIMALVLGRASFASADGVYKTVVDLATPGKISGLPNNTVNLLAYNGWDVLTGKSPRPLQWQFESDLQFSD
ncbi:hypothetical protein HK102_006239 [Quaeritorhiza haematococci]|nr:hypothetical protein HK102_006239 [Quaeritorhiza haematococci]